MDVELYMHCTDCGEAFDNLASAFLHDCTEDNDLKEDRTYTLGEL